MKMVSNCIEILAQLEIILENAFSFVENSKICIIPDQKSTAL